nr:hypothetical protein CTI12_AA123990 [Tanacetum cinerariifolium]
MLDQNISISQAFRMERDWCHSYSFVNVELRLLSERTNLRQYNALTVAEVATLITNDFRDGDHIRDIIINTKDGWPKRISELYPSYIVLQYPLLFPYGEDGYHDKIPYHRNTGTRKTNKDYITKKEYYAYVIQYRQNQGTTLHKVRSLFQQYLVDAYTTIEEQRLSWKRNNEYTLGVDLYHNVCDTITRGDTNAAGLGKRIMLPYTFIGGPRYMMQNYQDVVALSQAYGNPNMFITFTSNPKWPEINEMLTHVPRATKVIKENMLTDWFSLNEWHPPARARTYAEIPQYYAWYDRSKMWKPQKQKKCIGRIVCSTPASGNGLELYKEQVCGY